MSAGLKKIPISQGLVTHLQSYTNTASADIAGNCAAAADIASLSAVFDVISLHRTASVWVFHDVLKVFHDVLLVINDVLCVFHNV